MNVTRQTRTGNLVVTQDATAGAPKPPHTTLLDVVYVVRPGTNNESLRYSLRSLVNMPHGNVYISGGQPEWLHGTRGVVKDVGDMELPDQEDSNLNLYLAAGVPEVSENFIFMNDDFFIMEPITELDDFHQGSLDAKIASYRTDNRFHQAYSLITTKRELIKRGLGPDLLSYELHLPMVFNKAKLMGMFNSWQEPLFALRPRTMYGNLYNLKGVNTSDAKDSTNPEAKFLSSGTDFDISLAGERVRARFPRPGAYEPPAITG